MTERLLHFIWQFQYFSKSELITTTGETVQVLFPGQYNMNQGPDFSDAKIRIDKTTWAGSVEIHLQTADWTKHKHQLDKNYNNVILHVVWEDDVDWNTMTTGTVPAKGTKGYSSLPILELKSRVSKILLQRYEELMNSDSFIPCEKSIHTVKEIILDSWKERLLVERLLRKAVIIDTYLQQNNYHWEETFWWLLARNFGMKVNGDAFESVARSISINLLVRHKKNIHQVEAFLFGQAGFLDEQLKDDYPKLLKREYAFLKKKYSLKTIHLPIHFLRMRPGNFPTIRLAQLAMLITASTHLFSKIKESNFVTEVGKWFDITANDYWHYHYRFDEAAPFKKKKLGENMMNNIIINTIVPVLFAYGTYYNENNMREKALQWLEKTPAENNHITKGFQQLRIKNNTAFDSQALLELKNEYCHKKRCLECRVGNALLKA